MTEKMNKFSSRITEPKSQGASQAMLYGIGMSDADMKKAQVGISSVWYEGNTCNMHLNDLAARVKAGVEEAGLVGLRFNTIGVSDGISMGTEGMSYSLPSRDLIADSIETVMRAQWYDANISLPGCDKNMPGCLIAMARVNRPALMVYGGTIRAGELDGVKLDIVSAFQSYGEYMAGTIDEQRRQAIVKKSCPGAGACGGMYTANTMASAIEAMGMSLPFSASRPAESDQKKDECRRAGEAILHLLKADIKPRDIMTREAFENALVVLTVLGGSTNAVLHLIAMARAVDVPLSIDDFQRVSDRVPLLADMKPSGTYVQEDLDRIGGIPALMKVLLDEGLLDGRLPDRHRPDRGREPEGCGRIRTGPANRAPPGRPHPPHRSHPDPAGQPGTGRCGGQNYRKGGRRLQWTGQCVRFRRGDADGPGGGADR